MTQVKLPGITDVPDADEMGPDGWATPQYVLNIAYHVLCARPVGLDPCSNPRSLVEALTRWSKADDSLSMPPAAWAAAGTIWLNPPYSDPAPFLERLAEATALGARGVALLRHDHTTAWWRGFCRGRPLLLLSGRVSFLGSPGTGNFSSTLVYFGEATPGARDRWLSHSALGDVRW